MPKVSNRQQTLKWVKQQMDLSILMESSSDDELLNSSGSDKSSQSSSRDSGMGMDSSTDSEAGVKDPANVAMNPGQWLELYATLENQRFLETKTKRVQSKETADHFFRSELPEGIFRQMVRMDKNAFFALLDLIEMHPIFSNRSCHDQAPVSLQLATCLDRLGHTGNGCGLKRTLLRWGVSVGSCVNYTSRCVTALEEVLAHIVKWPNRDERKIISDEFAKHGFPGCVGLVDGTTFPLAQRPRDEGESYFDKKLKYSVNAQVVCDHRQNITFFYCGTPGSCQDIVCLKRSVLWKKIHGNSAFDSQQYVLGDSAYVNAPHMVAPYRDTANDKDREDFNTCVAKTRRINEHCIGVLKSRWPSLKEIRTQLNSSKDNVWMCRWIGACVMLHNFVLSQNDTWREEDMVDCPIEREEDVDTNAGEAITRSEYSQIAGQALQEQVVQLTLEFNRQPGGCLYEL